MFKLIREWLRQRIINRSTAASGSGDNAFRQMPLLDN